MDASIVEIAISSVIREARGRVEEAARIGKAAYACARAGRTTIGVEIANDIDCLVRDAARLLGTGITLARLAESGLRNSHCREELLRSKVAETRTPAPGPASRAFELGACLNQASARLDLALGIARSAESHSEIGATHEALRISLDAEPPREGSQRLHDPERNTTEEVQPALAF